jgi:hypothetical protein
MYVCIGKYSIDLVLYYLWIIGKSVCVNSVISILTSKSADFNCLLICFLEETHGPRTITILLTSASLSNSLMHGSDIVN